MVRPLKARMESSTKPASFSVSVWIATWTSYSSATPSAQSMAAGVVPQSSWSLRPMAPAAICSRSGSGAEALPLARKPRLIGNASAASSMRWMFHSPGVQVVAAVPVAGPVPPPTSVVSPALSASVTICGQMKWMWVSRPPAVTEADVGLHDAPVIHDHRVGDDRVENLVHPRGARRLAHAVADHLAAAE